MRYVYVLYSPKLSQFYVGSTFSLEKRLIEHNVGKVPATRELVPLRMVHYEAFKNKYDAFLREKWLITGYARRHLRKTLHNLIKSLGGQSGY